ncbi:MAG: helix-hairpin-helix domain-containing protein [Anaerolineae bacterium]|nr:helix-hairpin-helix domain-containing protein [Anaerolineae bacterium]
MKLSVVAPSDKHLAIRDFQRIPGVGRQIAEDLWALGYRSVEELRGQDPDSMYEKLCDQSHVIIDRCMLYVFRCAVYFASNSRHDPELLKWWRWKDRQKAANE